MEFLEKYIEFPVRILRLKPQINQQIFRTALSLIVRRNLTSESGTMLVIVIVAQWIPTVIIKFK